MKLRSKTICTLIFLFFPAALIAHTIPFTLMEFNIEHGGTLVNFAKVVEAIQAANPDVIAIEEAAGTLPQLARQLGYPYYDTRLHLISKYPLIDPPGGNGIYTFVELQPGKIVAVSNVHLPSDPYGPEAFYQGIPDFEILDLERSIRLPALKKQLELLPPLAKAGIPVFLTGDFNAPSHLDWKNAESRSLEWPLSKALAESDFHDSYREIHPDELLHPGPTWWAGRPQVAGWNPAPHDPHDRIDFIYSAGPAQTIESEIVGEEGGPGVSIPISHPWPTDHRGILSTFVVTPADSPVFIAVNKRQIAIGETVMVRYHASESSEGSIVIMRVERPLVGTGSETVRYSCRPKADGSLNFSTRGWKAGTYEAELRDAHQHVLSQIPFYVKVPGSSVKLSLDKKIYQPGETITARWKNAPGNRFDWIAIRPQGTALTEDSTGILKAHTNATIEGVHTFNAFTADLWPLAPGAYELLYLIDDSYEIAKAEAFIIT